MLYDVALTRGSVRHVIQVEAPSFDQIVDVLLPLLHDETHLSHASTSSDMVHLAVLRHEVSRAQQAFNDAIAKVQTEEARQSGGAHAVPEEGA